MFVIAKPFMAFVSMIMLATNNYHERAYKVLLLIVYNATYSISLYSLIIFYLALKNLISQFKPVQKFVVSNDSCDETLP